MRISDTLRMAAKNISRMAALIIAVLAVAMYGLLVGGNVIFTLAEEKAQSAELVLSSSSGMTDAAIVEIKKIDDVLSVSPVIEQTANIFAGEYSIKEAAITGIDANYLSVSLEQGAIFPKSTVMPYILMNKAALKLFRDSNDKELGKDAKIDWLKLSASIGVEKTIVAKICGIIADEDETPRIYISLSSAKTVSGSGYTGAVARITNSGCAEAVSKAAAKLGLTVENSDAERQEKWNSMEKEMIYLLITSICILLCGYVVLRVLNSLELNKRRKQLDMMRLCGMPLKQLQGIFTLSNVIKLVVALILSLLLSLTVPAFIPQELASSVFRLPLSLNSLAYLMLFTVFCMALMKAVISRLFKQCVCRIENN